MLTVERLIGPQLRVIKPCGIYFASGGA